jgi:hypothetical protein
MQFADAWNTQDHGITAVVHGSTDPQRIGVTAEQTRLLDGPVHFDDFATFADHVISAAIDLFSGLTPTAELSSPPLLRAAG